MVTLLPTLIGKAMTKDVPMSGATAHGIRPGTILLTIIPGMTHGMTPGIMTMDGAGATIPGTIVITGMALGDGEPTIMVTMVTMAVITILIADITVAEVKQLLVLATIQYMVAAQVLPGLVVHL